MRIGNIEVNNPLILGPMAGVTDWAFRTICAELGANITVTEMVSSRALVYKDKKSAALLRKNEGSICGAQIFGNDPEIMAQGAQLAMEISGADFLDINMGCPMPKIANSGDGCGLMRTPELAQKIVESVVKAVDVPVTVKCRLGWDKGNINVLDFTARMEDAGAAMLCVHGRTRSMLYTGKADWDTIAKVKQQRSIPVIANGDIDSAEAAVRCKKWTGADGVMIGRATFGNPWIFQQSKAALAGEEVPADGYGLMCPTLAERWSRELGIDYVASGMNTRCSFEKGMVFTFDFHEFAEKVAGGYVVKDAWGHDVDVRNVELILTTSMLKLWKCYDSIEHYLQCCRENHYTFGIPKVCPKELESWRSTNYQFLQPYVLTDEQIDELIEPTMQEIRDVLTGDYKKTLIFLRGMNVNEDNAEACDVHYIQAMMADERVFDDPFVKAKIYKSIKRRIDDAKIGVIGVHGNYSMVCGDPFALCQSVFGLEVTGLLRKHEIYNRYWVDAGAKDVAVFRAPMSCHNNTLKMQVACGEDVQHWYQYMTTCTLFNAWDSSAAALNGMD